MRFADLTPSLKNFNPIPGATFGAEASGAPAADNLIYPLVAPLRIPVYLCYPLETKSTFAITATV